MFVKDYLVNLLVKKFNSNKIGGAFILDCVGNWDSAPDTQVRNIFLSEVHKI